jgi:hypothetical protein
MATGCSSCTPFYSIYFSTPLHHIISYVSLPKCPILEFLFCQVLRTYPLFFICCLKPVSVPLCAGEGKDTVLGMYVLGCVCFFPTLSVQNYSLLHELTVFLRRTKYIPEQVRESILFFCIVGDELAELGGAESCSRRVV